MLQQQQQQQQSHQRSIYRSLQKRQQRRRRRIFAQRGNNTGRAWMDDWGRIVTRKCQGLGAVLSCCMVVALLMLPGCSWWWHSSRVSTTFNTAVVLPCLPRAWLSVAQARVALWQAYQVLPPSRVRNGTALYQTAWQTWQAIAAQQEAVLVTLHFVQDENDIKNAKKLVSTAPTTVPRLATRVAALVPQVARRPLRWMRRRRRRKDLESPPDDLVVVVDHDKQENVAATTILPANNNNNNQATAHWFPVVVRQSIAADDKDSTAATTDPVTIQSCTVGTVQTCPSDEDAVAIPPVPSSSLLESTTLSSSIVLLHQMCCGTALWERLLGSSSALDAADHGHKSYYQHMEQRHAYALRAPLVWDLIGKHPADNKNNKKQNNEAWLVQLLSTWPSPLLPLMIRWYKDDDDVHPTTFAVQPNDNNTVTTAPPPPVLPKLLKKLDYLVVPAGEDENESQFVALRIVLNKGY